MNQDEAVNNTEPVDVFAKDVPTPETPQPQPEPKQIACYVSVVPTGQKPMNGEAIHVSSDRELELLVSQVGRNLENALLRDVPYALRTSPKDIAYIMPEVLRNAIVYFHIE